MTNDEKLSRFVDQLDDEDELKNSHKRDKQEYKQLQLMAKLSLNRGKKMWNGMCEITFKEKFSGHNNEVIIL